MAARRTAVDFRDAVAADVPAITALLTQLNHAEGLAYEADAPALEKALFGRHRRVALRALVAEESDHVVAVALYYPGYDIFTATDGYHLGDFVVEETRRVQGIGSFLFAELARRNLEEGGKWMSLTVLRKNEAAKAFYKRIGMTQVEVDFFAIGAAKLSTLSASLMGVLHK